ncbi:MAG TPA: CsbD family protein [Dehalococcoidia bacterium]|nr:CsbD family protein [Dehalococcoidia bacterium]
MERQAEGWTQKMRGRIRSTWGEVTDDDIDQARGNVDRLVGTIKQKAGEAEESIRERLRGWEREEDTASAHD